MPDLFIELENIILKIRLLKEEEALEEFYMDDMIRLNYSSFCELKNMDFYLDYMSYIDFTKMVSKELTKSIHIMKKDTLIRKMQIQKLKEQKLKLIDDIVSYSVFSRQDLKELLCIFYEHPDGILKKIWMQNTNSIPFFIKKNHKLFMNNILKGYATKELIDFVKFYINLRSWQENLDIKNAYILYRLEQKETEKQFRTCIIR